MLPGFIGGRASPSWPAPSLERNLHHDESRSRIPIPPRRPIRQPSGASSCREGLSEKYALKGCGKPHPAGKSRLSLSCTALPRFHHLVEYGGSRAAPHYRTCGFGKDERSARVRCAPFGTGRFLYRPAPDGPQGARRPLGACTRRRHALDRRSGSACLEARVASSRQ